MRLRRGKALRWAGVALLFGCLPVLAESSPSARVTDEVASAARGAALFEGREPLTGKIRDHSMAMPPSVVACGNCHTRQARSSTLPNEAPRLDRRSLLMPASRRNGPISAYDQGSFCRALQRDIDPRAIVLARAMPLFAVSPMQCASLWMFLTEDKSS